MCWRGAGISGDAAEVDMPTRLALVGRCWGPHLSYISGLAAGKKRVQSCRLHHGTPVAWRSLAHRPVASVPSAFRCRGAAILPNMSQLAEFVPIRFRAETLVTLKRTGTSLKVEAFDLGNVVAKLSRDLVL